MQDRSDNILEELRKFIEKRQTIGKGMHGLHEYLKERDGQDMSARLSPWSVARYRSVRSCWLRPVTGEHAERSHSFSCSLFG